MPSNRIDDLNAAMGWGPFTLDEQRRIDFDAERSAEVLAADLPRIQVPHPERVHWPIFEGLAKELVARHYSYTIKERRVKRPVLDFDRTDPYDPWVIGGKFLAMYSGAPRYLHQLDFISDWEQVAERYINDPDGTGLYRRHRCDVRVAVRCAGNLKELATLKHKTGQYLCIVRCCPGCIEYIADGKGEPLRGRLREILSYVEVPGAPPDLRLTELH